MIWVGFENSLEKKTTNTEKKTNLVTALAAFNCNYLIKSLKLENVFYMTNQEI